MGWGHGRAAFIFIFITALLDMLALGVMVPVLPKLLVLMQGGDVASGAVLAGIFGFVWALMQFIFSPILGVLSDRIGRRPIVLLSNVGLGLDYILMALAPSVPWLFVGRIISGITASSLPTASAYIADVTTPEKRAEKFGMLGAAFGLGFIIGPAVGGILGAIHLRLPFWVAAGLSLANACYGYFILPESLPKEFRSKGFSWSLIHPLNSLTLFRVHSGLIGFGIVGFLSFLAHEVLPSTFVLYTGYRYGWSANKVGIVLMIVGLSATIVSAILVGVIVKWCGEGLTLMIGLLFGAIGFGIYGFAPVEGFFLMGIPFVAMWSLTSPAIQSLMTQRVSSEHQGQLQGMLGSMRGIAGMLGPILFTQVFSFFISENPPLSLPGASFFLASLLLLGSLLLTLLWANWRNIVD